MPQPLKKGDPFDAQIEARRLLKKQGYQSNGTMAAGLPPGPGSDGIGGRYSTAQIGGKEITSPVASDDGPEWTKTPMEGSAINEMRNKTKVAAEESSYVPSTVRAKRWPYRSAQGQ